MQAHMLTGLCGKLQDMMALLHPASWSSLGRMGHGSLVLAALGVIAMGLGLPAMWQVIRQRGVTAAARHGRMASVQQMAPRLRGYSSAQLTRLRLRQTELGVKLTIVMVEQCPRSLAMSALATWCSSLTMWPVCRSNIRRQRGRGGQHSGVGRAAANPRNGGIQRLAQNRA